MRQFFVKRRIKNIFYLELDDVYHAYRVLRLKTNEKILCIYNQQKFFCKVTKINSKEVVCELVEEVAVAQTKQYQITFYLPLTKQKIWDLMVEKLTELDCDVFVPVLFSRCQKNDVIRIDRLEKIIETAAKQSNRINLAQIKPLIDSERMFEELERYDLVLFADERSRLLEFAQITRTQMQKTIALIIGPAGGFSKEEFEILTDKAISIKLSNNILRSETAAIALINYFYFAIEGLK
ncbi:16S rRNA (uracil1498-N3)-methyltransferase [Mycoplasmoides fastidiosum]|uniref:Ribosomal RNA small subunit methyltransferase E n=1 Tax=Mycoplasmoides fastidiosum TaxID=92758 RepID=A0ABU0LYG0_9BACT|nr:RsmE family RNA methyltransferase [Mycoplasmoides fastidiosum]MDQ0513739.1 16S rRNA (uracil1498-N3)-methyltransferase [Mycoplasmoides fastidiosum]UUD37840.1 16S rRNA (uracil(1498)-N(3))-methyltransferase [Mycoplasmoides fastidiosum]